MSWGTKKLGYTCFKFFFILHVHFAVIRVLYLQLYCGKACHRVLQSSLHIHRIKKCFEIKIVNFNCDSSLETIKFDCNCV